jgi:hypothetical protein
MEPKHKSRSDNEADKMCKGTALDERIMIQDKLGDGMSAAAVDRTFSSYFVSKSNFPFGFF